MRGDLRLDRATDRRTSLLDGPPINADFAAALDELVATARVGQPPESEFYNPPDEWLVRRMRIFGELPAEEQRQIREEYEQIKHEAAAANSSGQAAVRSGPNVAFRLDSGGLAFFSQLGVARRPDLTQYFIDGFLRNRDAVAFSEENQELFAEVFRYITAYMKQSFASGGSIVQTDRQICDAPGRSFHARQLLFGTDYLQIPYMWRQLTFDLPDSELQAAPEILEVSLPRWLEDLRLPPALHDRVVEAGLSRLVFKAPTKGLSLHLGFDYVGEHKMGPLSIAMFLVKQNNGLPLQAALSVVAAKTIKGAMTNTAIITTGPSLHGKSTMTIMLELAGSDLARLVDLSEDPNEGVYPMNDDIVLLQPTSDVIETSRGGHHLRLSYGIDGTENSFYAVPFGLTPDQDPITYEVLRGTPEEANPLEILENVVVDPATGIPDFLQNPTRNMRMILSRSRLVERKGAGRVLQAITRGHMADSAHVPLQDVDRVFWQAVTRLNTIVPPLRRLNLKQYVRCLMYGEAVQMGAAIGAIGKPYVEYFSDPFIIGLEDENANLLFEVLQEMERDGQQQQFYVFNTGGIGADSDEGASGPKYKKIPRELTLMLQEALLRGAVKFEHDALLGSEFAAAIVNRDSEEVMNLRHEWLPRAIYGQAEYKRRVVDLERKRFYGRDSNDKSGILRYTKVSNALIDFLDIPSPRDERELAWLLSFYWYVDMAYGSLAEFLQHMHEGLRPTPYRLRALQRIYRAGPLYQAGLPLESQKALKALGIG